VLVLVVVVTRERTATAREVTITIEFEHGMVEVALCRRAKASSARVLVSRL